MKLGVCLSMDQAGPAAVAGFDYVEENVQNLLMPEQSDELFAENLRRVRSAALPVFAANCFLPGLLKCTGPDVDFDRLERYAENAFRRAQLAGLSFIVYGSGGARQVPDGFDAARARDQFLEGLRRLAPLAERHAITLVLEPLNRAECNFMNSLAEGASLVGETNHPRVRLLADIFHMLRDGESPDEIIQHGKWIRHVHVAECEGRMAPGTHRENFGPYLRALRSIRYSEAISFECGWNDFSAQAAPGVRSFREQLRRAGLE